MARVEVFTIPELAARLQISVRSAYRLCQRPGFPAVRIGGLIRVPVRQLEDWLDRSGKVAEVEEVTT